MKFIHMRLSDTQWSVNRTLDGHGIVFNMGHYVFAIYWGW